MEQKMYHWMVRQTAQKEWIIKRGIYLWLAFFFTEIGAGIYFVSIFLDFPEGWLLGWFISLALGGAIHFIFLGKPVRAWRMLLKPLSSELSRGLCITVIYAGVGLFHVAPVVIPGLPWSGDGFLIRIAMGVLCVLIMTHGFLTMNFIKAIPLWNSAMMIPLSLISGIWVGSQITQMLMVSLGLNIAAAEVWSRWSLLCFIMVIAMFLWSAARLSATSRISLKGILAGPVSFHFYIGVLFIGMVVPLIITLFVWEKDLSHFSGIFFVRMACVFIGDILMRYCIFHSGMYRPIVRHNAISLHG